MTVPVIRRGLPRVPGGEPWPVMDDAGAGAIAVVTVADNVQSVPTPAEVTKTTLSVPEDSSADTAVEVDVVVDGIRRGLPRVAGGGPWPPAAVAPRAVMPASARAPDVASTAPSSATAADSAVRVAPAPIARAALVLQRTAFNGAAPRVIPSAPTNDGKRPPPAWPQVVAGLFVAASLGLIAGAVVALMRTLLSSDWGQQFLSSYPGEYEPAIAFAPGFDPWVGWQHFFNMFLMVLIIRSGLRVRNEKRPTVFWAGKGKPKSKISLTLWFHQALDLLWITNGIIFIVLLFATGRWVRIVPTSLEVFPNAVSAAMQYLSFNWPTDHAWANYNSLQQLAYFVTIFIAAPIAVATGIRMSGLWPARAERLSRIFPVEVARAVHFPTMVYFVIFIIGHVALVFTTGILRNLNYMFASQDAATWTGFWVFVAAMVVIAIGWIAARPVVLAPVAKLFGTVSGR